jgi:hypothetical protein
MKPVKILFLSLFVLLSACLLTACTTAKDDKAQVESSDAIAATDYSQSAHWLNLPTAPDKKVDVFYLYPTAWARASDSDSIVSTIDDPVLLSNSKLAYNRQATAFETVANIYAPYYRQYDAAATSNMSSDEQQDVLKGVPLTDAMAAFEYYLDHYNNGRPFILASHSQGSNAMIYLMADYFKAHPEVQKRLVAAYVIGYSITDDYLADNPNLKFATGSGDTGVIISYNTQAPTIEGTDFVVLPTAHVINPISWTTTDTVAPASANLGSIAINPDGTVVTNPDGSFVKVMNFADAQVDTEKGALICSTVDVDTYAPGNAAFGKGVFHSYDYPFYYFNLRANAEERVANFLKNR